MSRVDEDECIHGLGPVSACVICNGRAEAEAKARAQTRTCIVAKYSGMCRTCREPIEIGERIAYAEGEYVQHWDCWEDQ